MKNIFIVCTVLVMASAASATMQLSIDGALNVPDSETTLLVGETVVVDIHADATVLGALAVQSLGGSGVISGDPTFLWEQSKVTNPSLMEADYKAILPDFGYPDVSQVLDIDVVDASEPYTQPDGLVIDGLIFECTGIGDVALLLFDINLTLHDSVLIHQVPEPITFALLGLGGLFLRRRK